MINDLIRQRLTQIGMATMLVPHASAVEIKIINEKLSSIERRKTCLDLIERAVIRPGTMILQIDHTQIASLLSVEAQHLNPDQLLFDASFQLRRRGVELKLHLGVTCPEIDLTLVRNIVKAQRWLAMVVDGKSVADIAKADGTSKRRVQDVVGLALLAPEYLDAIAIGEQPTGLTLDYLIKSGVPADWEEQRQMFTSL